MNPRICQVKNDPPHSYGDCIRACVATIIDRDDVPHVFDGRPFNEAWPAIRSWLAQHKKIIALFPTDNHKDFMKENNPGVPYILFHDTLRGSHAIICRDGELLHDPAWYRCGEQFPLKSLNCYIIGIIGDLI